MNIACSTTVFTRLSLEEALSRIAALGFLHVDLLMMENWAHINPSELVKDVPGISKRVSGLLRQHNLKAAAINANVSGSLTDTSSGVIEQNFAEAQALIDFAKAIKTKIVVLQPGSVGAGDDFEAAFEASSAALRQITAYGQKRNITIAIEAHSGSLAEKYLDALRFVSGVPGLKIAYDPSHCVMAELGLEGSGVLLPHTAHVHLRDAVKGNFQAPMGKGELDFMWVLEAIDSAGCRGAVSIEYLDNREEEILRDVGELKSLLEARYDHI